MRTLQIRLPDEILNQVDDLVHKGFYSSRSDFLKEATSRYIMEFKFAGSLPYIVGPYTNEEMNILKNNSQEDLIVDKESMKDIKEIIKIINI